MKINNLGKMSCPINAMPHGAQRGVGMIEVLVAMLLLAIGVLGYAALQVRAVEATGEALNRSQAMIILRGLAEEIRVNSSVQTGAGYPALVRGYTTYNATTAAPSPNCNTATCTATELANFDAYQTAKAAFNLGMTISMAACPSVPVVAGVPQRQCLYAAWGRTTLANVNPLPATPTTTDCMSAAGVYQSDATCLMMEAY